MLDRLENSGYVARERSELDRRVVLVKRTDKDREAQAAYERVSAAMSEVFYRGLEETEIEAFERVLEQILENLAAIEEGSS
jgi:MarR family transcriptional regulator for hemolysin